MENVYKRSYCDNCGRDSHCGSDATMPSYPQEPEFIRKIVICKHCHCNECTPVKEHSE